MDDGFGSIKSIVEPDVKDVEQSFLELQQRRIEMMVKDPKWVPILESMEARIEYYKSMQWIDPNVTNEEIGQNAKVGAIVISELEGILNEIRAVAGFERVNQSVGSPEKNKKPVQKRS